MGEDGGAWRWDAIDDLGPRDVHDLLKLRMDVFVVEQACAFGEIDGRDLEAWHLRRLVGPDLAGCLRVLPPTDAGDAPRIGRVAVSATARGTGLGHRLMEEGVRFCRERFPGRPIELSAQAHLVPFYGRHGFHSVSDAYLEDDIPHVDMRRPAD